MKKLRPCFSLAFAVILLVAVPNLGLAGNTQYDRDVAVEYQEQACVFWLTQEGQPSINLVVDTSAVPATFEEDSRGKYLGPDPLGFPRLSITANYDWQGRPWSEAKEWVDSDFYDEDPRSWTTIDGYEAWVFNHGGNLHVEPGMEDSLLFAVTLTIHIHDLDLPDGTCFMLTVGIEALYPGTEMEHIERLLAVAKRLSVRLEAPAADVLPPVGTTGQTTTEAGNVPGDDAQASVTIPQVIAVGLAGAVAAAAATAGGGGTAATAAGGSGSATKKSTQNKEQEPEPTLRMIISKNFGEYIRYADDHVFVYARIVEIMPGGGEKDRPDLTSLIQITTPSACLDLGLAQMSGDSMGAAVRAPGYQSNKPLEATISFSLTAGGNSFTNHVVFKMLDLAEIIADDSVMLNESMQGTPDQVAVPFQLANFFDAAGTEVTLEMKAGQLPFTFTVESGADGKGVIRLANDGSRQNTEEMFSYYHGTLKAKSSKDEAEHRFLVVTCRDGLYVDFGEDKEPEIRCYRNAISHEMETTRLLVGLALFDYEARRLKVLAPEEIEFSIKDEKGIGEKIGLETERSPHPVKGRFADDQWFAEFITQAKKPLSYPDEIPASLEIFCQHGEEELFMAQKIALKPDSILYYSEFDEQYRHLRKLVTDNFSAEAAKPHVQALDEIRARLAVADLRSYERYMRKALQVVLEEKAAHDLAVARNWDMATSAVEWTAWVGDIAFDLVVGSVAGPIGIVLADGGKELIVEAARQMLANPSGFRSEMVIDIAWSKLKASLTKNVDGLFEFPKPPDYHKIALWLVAYTTYRIFWHWEYDKDPLTGESLGLENAVKQAVRDVTVQSSLKLGMERMLRGRLFVASDAQGQRIYSKTVRRNARNLRVKDQALVSKVKAGSKKYGEQAMAQAAKGVVALDGAATDALTAGIGAGDAVFQAAGEAVVAALEYFSNLATDAVIASLKAFKII